MIPLQIIIPAVVAPVVVILVCCVLLVVGIVCFTRRAGKKKEQQYTNLIAKMELLEYEMADECKRGKPNSLCLPHVRMYVIRISTHALLFPLWFPFPYIWLY